jgi:adenylylsulfate kinase-like enzyme
VTGPPDAHGVVWLTGLPGAGKTTVATALRGLLHEANLNPIVFDGDRMREILPVRLGYHQHERHRLALFYAQLAADLARQGHLVICSTVSLFHDVQQWNRRNTARYVEVWLRVPLAELRRRRPDIPAIHEFAEFPRNPDLVIDNYAGLTPEHAAHQIATAVRHRLCQCADRHDEAGRAGRRDR